MTTVGSPRMRWVSLLGLFMMLMSATPTGVAAQIGLTPADDVAQTDTEATSEAGNAGPGIELLIGECPPDASADPSDLVPGCMQEGLAGVNVQVTSTDPNLGIDLPKVSEQPSVPGPGVINTGSIPLGEYRVLVDLPAEENNLFFECRVRDTDAEVPTSPSPDGAANAFLVTTQGEADIVCNAFVTPQGSSAVVDITYRECSRADLPNDSREFADLQEHCTNISTNPPTFNVRDMNQPEQPVTQHQQDAEGKLRLTPAPGNYEMFTDLDMDQWGEYLHCEYPGQPLYEKEFHPTRGIVEFSNLLPNEEITCYWFAVSATGEAPDDVEQTTPEQGADEEQPADQDDQANQDEQPPEDEQATQPVEDQQADDPTFSITYRECTRGDLEGDDRSYAQLSENCTYFNQPGPTFTIQENDQSQTTETLDENGVMNFSHSTDSFIIFSDLPMDSWGEYLFCQYGDVELYDKPFDPASGFTSFSDLQAGEAFECFWFGVNSSETPTEGAETPEPTATEPAEPSPTPTEVPEEPVDEGTISVQLNTCDVGYQAAGPGAWMQFQEDCTTPVDNTVFNLTNDANVEVADVTNENGQVAFEDVPEGDLRVWSEIPLEFGTEYYFCAAGDEPPTYVELSDRGVASFPEYAGEAIDCQVYLVPEDQRGDVTGSSVEIHLALCPENYDGSSWYTDCHDEGIGEMPFTLTGPAGELTTETVVERTPGPGIARFTELPAGEYVLAGGPPQDFGSVFLYCSDPVTNTEIDTRFEDGVGHFTLAEEQNVVCDWYYVPDGQGETTPTPEPTSEPSTAEIFTTMFVCPPDVNVAGASFSELDGACAEHLNDVPMTLQSPGGVPITANTGESGDGAIRFYELDGGDYVLTPKLPAEYVSAAVYCDLDGGDVYQKALSNGATTFVDVDGELISCSWFVTAKPEPAPGPTGSITIREMLCEGDRASIVDWERECQPGASGVSFTITSTNGEVTQTLTPDDSGVAVFSGLPNEYYEVEQSEGAWCRAQAERVDSQSRVIVSGGGNTDVFLYQCNQQIGLPDTGAGPTSSGTEIPVKESLMLGAAALPLFGIAGWQIRRWQSANIASEPVRVHDPHTRTRDGYRYR